MRMGGQHHAPADLPPGKTRYPLYRRLGGTQGRPGWVRKISPPTGFDPTDRPARSESHYHLSYPRPTSNVRTKRSRSHFWRGKAKGITYSEYVFVALGTTL
jgi:hypothetical protein